jgi:DNA-binding MarR family transcriptional regulator
MIKQAKSMADGAQASLSAPAPGIAPSLDGMLCFALYNASATMTRLYRPLLEPLGLTYPQYLVMVTLWDSAPRAVGDIGAALDLDSGTLTPLLKRLEAAGLVTRARDKVDERRVIIDLTAAGQALKTAADGVREALACSLSLTAAEAKALNTLLRRFTAGPQGA